jgi:hypothetical protein
MQAIKETIKQHGQYIVKYEDPDVPVLCVNKMAMGLAWPTADKDGYYCVIAEEIGKPIIPELEHRPLTLLDEGEYSLLPELFDGLGESARKCSCTNIYAQFNPAVVHKPGFDGTNKAFVTAFNDYKAKRVATLNLLSLQPPLISDWLVGILTVQKWNEEKGLHIARGSILDWQSSQLLHSDRRQTEQDRFPAITALVCAMTPFVTAIVQRGTGLRQVVPAKYVW